MIKYIEREKAIEAAFSADGLGNSTFRDVHDVVDRLRLIPAADVVERSCFDRILAENDDMREQLEKVGKLPGDDMSDLGVVRRGEWIRTDGIVSGIVSRVCSCSLCKGNAGVSADNGFWYLSDFCPNCGAKMGRRREGCE